MHPRPSASRLPRLALLAAGLALLAPLSAQPHRPESPVATPDAPAETAAPVPAADLPPISAPELRERLAAFYVVAIGAMENAALRAGDDKADIHQLRVLASAKIRALRIYRAVIFQNDPLAAFLDTWTLTVQYRGYLAEPTGAAEFGDAAPTLLESVRRLEHEIRQIGAAFIPAERLEAIGAQIEDFTQKHPVTSTRAVSAPTIREDDSGGELSWLLHLPLAPFHAMDGVDQAAQSITDLAKVVDSLLHTVATIPVETSWESELILLQARRDVAALVEEKLERAETASRALVDHVFRRALQFLGLLVLAVVLLRLVWVRLAPR